MREARHRGLHQQERSEDVDSILSLEALDRGILDEFNICHSGIIDDDVDLELPGLGVREVVFREGDEVRGAGGVAYVGLDGQNGHIVCGADLGGDGVGFRG